MGSSSSISRPARPLAVIVLAGALLAALTTSAGAAPATAVGYDIAFPQCSEHGARYWLTRRHVVPKEEAVALTASLVWKGLAGFPLQHS